MLGLVLEGGGAKGSYHAGALKALLENNIKFNGVMGTSIGAVNGALVAQGNIEKCIELWETLLPSNFADVDDEKLNNLFRRKFDRATIRYLLKTIRGWISNKGISIEKAMEFLRSLIDEDKVRDSGIDFGLVTVSVTDRIPMEIFKEEIPYGMLHDYIMASSYIPVFRSELIDGKKYFDGGVYNNLPINPLIRRGYDEIFAIRTRSKMPHQPVIDDTVKVTYISPSDKIGGTISVYSASMSNNMNMGYYDTLRILNNYKGEKFYFAYMTDREYYQLLLELSDKSFDKLRKLFSLSADLTKSDIIKRLLTEIRLQTKCSYALSDYETFLNFLEKYATQCDIEKYKIYGLRDFLGIIAKKFCMTTKEKKSRFLNYIKTTFTKKSNTIFNIIISNYAGEEK